DWNHLTSVHNDYITDFDLVGSQADALSASDHPCRTAGQSQQVADHFLAAVSRQLPNVLAQPYKSNHETGGSSLSLGDHQDRGQPIQSVYTQPLFVQSSSCRSPEYGSGGDDGQAACPHWRSTEQTTTKCQQPGRKLHHWWCNPFQRSKPDAKQSREP